jgi:hypothetical protein
MGIRVLGGGRPWLLAAGVAGGGLAFATGSAPAGATTQPATIAVDQACYVESSTVPSMTVTGSGFEPDVPVTITSSSGKLSVQTTADASGDIDVSMQAPEPKFKQPVEKRETITATQQTSTSGVQIVGSTHAYFSTLGAEHGPTRKQDGLKALTEKTNWTFSGFPVGKTVYAHYLVKGKQVAYQSFGKAPAPCGVFTVRRRLFPATPKQGTYHLQIDTSRTFTHNTAPKITRLTVTLALEF